MNWNVQALSSRDRVKSILVDRPLGLPTTCTFQIERIIVDKDDATVTSSGLSPLMVTLEEAAQDPTLLPFVEQISAGFEGLASALYLRANPNAVIS